MKYVCNVCGAHVGVEIHEKFGFMTPASRYWMGTDAEVRRIDGETVVVWRSFEMVFCSAEHSLWGYTWKNKKDHTSPECAT